MPRAVPPNLKRAILPVEGTLTIDCYGDLHVGSPDCLEDLLERHLRETAADPHRYAVFLGDLFNSEIRTAKHGGVYAEKRGLDESLDWLEARLAPLAAAGKILAVTSGNHDKRAWNAAGIDPVRQLCARLRVADKYLPDGGWFKVAHGRARGSNDRHGRPRPIEYRGFIHHGTGTSKADHSLEIRAHTFDCDFILSGHTHNPKVTSIRGFRHNPQTDSYHEHDTKIVVVGSYLGYGGYALERTLAPKPNGRLVLRLADGEKCVEVAA